MHLEFSGVQAYIDNFAYYYIKYFRSALFELLAAVGIVSTVDKLVAFLSSSSSPWQRGHSPESDLICLFDVTSSICTVLSEDMSLTTCCVYTHR